MIEKIETISKSDGPIDSLADSEPMEGGLADIEKERSEWEQFIKEQKERTPIAEKAFGPGSVAIFKEGLNNPEAYEGFVIRRERFPAKYEGDDDVVWICFPGIGGLEDNSENLTPWVRSPELKGIGVSGLPMGIPNKLDVVPQQGEVFIFHGPTSIAGQTPEQCIDSTKKVKEAVDRIINERPGKKIRIFSLSAGTHLGFYVANQIGKEHGPVDKFVSVCPGMSIALGIYRTWVTEDLARHLLDKGIPQKQYYESVAEFSQEYNFEYLPEGRDMVIHAGNNDTFVPMDEPGGTNDLARHLRQNGKKFVYAKHNGADHVTLPLKLIIQQALNRDPYNLSTNLRSVWEVEGVHEDEMVISYVDGVLESYTDEELFQVLQALLNTKSQSKISVNQIDILFSQPEQAILWGLARRGVLEVLNSDSGSYGEDENQYLQLSDQTEAGFLSRCSLLKSGSNSLNNVLEKIQNLDSDEKFKLASEMLSTTEDNEVMAERELLDLTFPFLCIVDSSHPSERAEQTADLVLLVPGDRLEDAQAELNERNLPLKATDNITYRDRVLTYDNLRPQSTILDGLSVVALGKVSHHDVFESQ